MNTIIEIATSKIVITVDGKSFTEPLYSGMLRGCVVKPNSVANVLKNLANHINDKLNTNINIANVVILNKYHSLVPIRNLYKCIDSCGIRINKLITYNQFIVDKFNQHILDKCCNIIVDIGAGLTKISVIKDGVVSYHTMFGIAGNQITYDIREKYNISFEDAERIKCTYDNNNKDFNVASFNISISELSELIMNRMEDIIEFVNIELDSIPNLDKNKSQVIFTGGTAINYNFDVLLQDFQISQ